MKNKIITTLLFVSAFLYSFSQDNKPGPGAIGIHYGVNFNGAVQQFIGISGVIAPHWELGGNLSFGYTHNNVSASAPSGGGFSTTDGTRNSTYNFGLTPYLLYHFTINNNLDLYVGPNISVGFGNSNLHNYSTTTGTNYYQNTDELTSQPATVNLGAGGMLGCQYFFYKNLAVGVQAGLAIGYQFAKGNVVDITTTTNSGSNNSGPASTSSSSSNETQNNHSFNLSTMASGGISLAFYFARQSKKQ